MQETSSRDPRKRIEELFARLLETNPLQAPHYAQLQPGRLTGWMWECDEQSRLTWCSEEVEGILGYKPSELVGGAFPHWGFSAAASERLRAMMATRESIHNLRVEGSSKSGEHLSLLVNALARGPREELGWGYRGVVHVVSEPEIAGDAIQKPLENPAEAVTNLPPRAAPATQKPAWDQLPGFRIDNGEISQSDHAEEEEIPEMPEVQGALLRVPIPGQDRPLGIVEFDGKIDGSEWSTSDIALVSAIAQQLSLALQDARSDRLTQHALDELRLADRLKTQFLANISHELRTPLNSIIGFSRVILKGIDGPITETQEEDLSAIYKAGQHLLGLINNILDLSKIEAGRIELNYASVDLREIITEVIGTAEGLVQDKPIKILLDLPDQIPNMLGDGMRIHQILLNLISNAAKFTDKGEIKLLLEADEQKEVPEVIISVTDSGPGIKPEDQTRLFEPFSQVDAAETRQTGGTGLGLSISRHLVELHGGRIWVDSSPGVGSTFSFALPLAPPAIDESKFLPKILILKETPGVFAWYRAKFAAAGYDAVTLDDPWQAGELAAEIKPLSILLNPSEEDNWRLLPRIKSADHTWRIPVQTAMLHEDGAQGVHMGIAGYLVKPFVPLHVYTQVNRFLDPLESHTLLLIDHLEDDLKQLQEKIEEMGDIRVRTAATGFEGLVAARSETPEMVILNLFMPKADGFRMIEALRMDEQTRSVPVLVLIPEEFSEAHLQQLRYWTEHYQQTLSTPADALLHTLLEEITAQRS